MLLAGLFAWLIWPRTWPGARLAVLPVIGYDIPIPPVPFSYVDRDAFLHCSAALKPAILQQLQDSENLKRVYERLQGLLQSPDEILIVYLSAHGVSVEGKPYILASDYFRQPTQPETAGEDPRALPRGLCELEGLLRQIADCRARLKLLLLDCNHLLSDPRLGMAVNEFPRLLEQAVTKIGDPRFWVLASARPLETSRVCYAAKRSVFAHFVTEALRGEADADQDRRVDLAEFYAFVVGGLSDYVQGQGAPGQTQRPMLLCGTRGLVSDPPKEFLFRVAPAAAAEPETLQASPEESGSPGQDAAALGPKEPTAPLVKEPEPQAAAEQWAFPKQEVRALLAKAWRWRDTRQLREGLEQISPVDFAPHLWREYQELLLGYEMRYRAGSPWIEGRLADLRGLGSSDAPAGGFSPRSVRARLQQAEQRYIAGGGLARLKDLPPELQVVREAIELKNELLFAAPYYVRWSAQAAALAPDSPVPRPQIAELLASKLPPFVALLERFEHPDQLGKPARFGQEDLRELRERKEELERLRRKIEREGLEDQAARLRQLVRRPTEGQQSALVGRIESLLATPLLSAESRMGLLDALEQASVVPAEFARPTAKPAQDAGTELKRWEALARHASLEIELVRLVDPEFSFSVDLAQFGNPAPQQEAQRWQEARRLGVDLRDFYAALPARIAQGARSGQGADLRRAGRLLPLLDARDVIADARRLPPRLEDQITAIVVPRIALPEPEKPALAVDCPKAVELKRDDAWVDLPVAVRSTVGAAGSLRVQYNATVLELRIPEGKLPIRPNSWEKLSLGPDGTARLLLQARAKDLPRWKGPEEISLEIRVGQESHSQKIELALAPEDVVDLVVERIVDQAGSTAPQSGSAQGGQTGLILCDVFPNRTTAYLFALKDRSARKRKVTVQFWPAPERSREDQLVRRVPDRPFQPGPDAEPLTGPIELVLSGGQAPQPIPFPEPKALEKPEKGQKTQGPQPAKSEAEKPKPQGPNPGLDTGAQPPGVEVPHGIVAVIQDLATKATWTWWIEFRGVKPTSYLQSQVSYREADGKIRVRLKPASDPKSLPLLSAPIQVRWEGIAQTEREVAVRPNPSVAELARPGAEDELAADAPRDRTKVVPVWLTVDGYPRALVYEVECDRTRENIEPRRDLRRVWIRAPREGAAFASPLPDASPLTVQFEADAPYDAFLKPDERVEVALDLKGNPLLAEKSAKTFYADRQWTVRWLGASPEGIVKVDAEVGDFRVPMNTYRLSETDLDIRVRLILPKYDEKPREARVGIILDEEKPEILAFNVPSEPVPKDGQVRVSVRLRDRSGIDRVLLGLVKDQSALLDEKDKLRELSGAAIGERVDELPVPLNEAKTELIPGQRYFLAVRVWDKVGHSNQEVRTIRIAEQAAAAQPAQSAGSIEGQVYYSRSGRVVDWTRLDVRIEKLGLSAETTDNGRFLFKEVPPGTYTVEALGTAMNTSGLKGSASVTVKGGTERITIIAQ